MQWARRSRTRGGYLVTYHFPGRWMDDRELSWLRAEIERIALDRLGALPDYGVFLPGRAAFENRIVTLLYCDYASEPQAFSAMVHTPVVIGGRTQDVINLGLAVARRNGIAGSPLLRLYVTALFEHGILRGVRPFWIATFTSAPSAVGSIGDAFSHVYPHYAGRTPVSPMHVAIAKKIFDDWRHESGVGPDAEFDPSSFVVRKSDAGPSAILRNDFPSAPKYRVRAANEYCRRMLDYDRGDGLLMVGRAGWGTAFRSVLGRLGPPR